MTDREKIVSDSYYDLITDFVPPPGGANSVQDYVIQPVDGEIAVTYVPGNEISPINLTEYTYPVLPKVYGLMQMEAGNGQSFDPTPLIYSGITKVQRAPLNLTGNGVVIGFLDTGIRYDDPVFLNPDGTSRILGIWDQTIQTGEPPAGILYGTEYRKEVIDIALRSDNPREIVPSYDENGHGTVLASIAAGSSLGNGLRFLGAAPDAEIVMVKLRQAKPFLRDFYLVPDDTIVYAESDLLVALKYLESYAISISRPLVICFGIGSNMGDHEGHSVLADYMNRIATRRSRAIVVCGGNEGNSAHHYVGSATEGMAETVDNVEIRVGDGVAGFTAELWGSISANHAISIRAPGGETTSRVDFRGREQREFQFIYERTRIQVDHVLVEQSSGEELIFFRFLDPTPGIWTIQVIITSERSSETTFHIWLPIVEILGNDTYFLKPSPYTTLTEPSNARDVITTSAYNDANGSIWSESGRGYTRSGQIKPDFSAPGVNVSSILGTRTGPCLAAAITAGAAAQFLQWAVVEMNRPWVESRELKNYLIRGANRSDEMFYPNREWGYGRLDIAGTFEVLAGV
ncbi:MAG: S8 family peptidase [Lachnospiraceae bacterium]|nr:S8 family peptidase [Lachnospiraceae bacterium]